MIVIECQTHLRAAAEALLKAGVGCPNIRDQRIRAGYHGIGLRRGLMRPVQQPDHRGIEEPYPRDDGFWSESARAAGASFRSSLAGHAGRREENPDAEDYRSIPRLVVGLARPTRD